MEKERKYEDYVLYVEDLSLEYTVSGKSVKALNNLNFGIRKNESVGIVGESGCGKSTLAMAISHILPLNSVVTSGKIYFQGEVVVDEDMGAHFSLQPNSKSKKVEAQLSKIRWQGISIVFQGALDSLNPLFTVGQQLDDIFIHKEKLQPKEARGKSKKIISTMGLDDWVIDAFPHQLSGGMKQRVIIAMAITLHPVLILADEPTTSLDVITQYRIIEELQKLRDQYEMSIINISHDISLVSHLSDRIMVMYAGRIVEKVPENSFANVQHPYTRLLINSIPSLAGKRKELESIGGSPPSLIEKITGCTFYERCKYAIDACKEEGSANLVEVRKDHMVGCSVLPFKNELTGGRKNREDEAKDQNDNFAGQGKEIVQFNNVTREFAKKTGLRVKNIGAKSRVSKVIAVNNVTFSMREGDSVALVGETGSGKTTISRILGLLDVPTKGELIIDGERVNYLKKKWDAKYRQLIQTIFQDPFQSINPRHSVYQIVSEPLRVHKVYNTESEIEKAVTQELAMVELTPPDDYKGKYPHQLSGGQRQRVAIARNLIMRPKVVIADEPISMLDVSMRAGILNLLRDRQKNSGATLFYITHDIASARYVSNKIMVMYKGNIVESGDTEEVMKNPSHPYTIALILASLGIEGKLESVLGPNIFGEIQETARGCIFANRCPLARDKCKKEDPAQLKLSENHQAKCHFSKDLFENVVEGGKIVSEVEARKNFQETLKKVEVSIGKK